MSRIFSIHQAILVAFWIARVPVGIAQEPVVQIDVRVTDDEKGKKLPGVSMFIYRDGEIIDTLVSDQVGKFPLYNAQLQANYQFKLWKRNYVPKIVWVNTHFDDPSNLSPVTYVPMQASLFLECRGVNWSILTEEPMIKFSFTSMGFQDYDHLYTREMLAKIETLRHECKTLAVQRHEESIASRSEAPTGNQNLNTPSNGWSSEDSIELIAPEYTVKRKPRK
jgi:hypothetical protein